MLFDNPQLVEGSSLKNATIPSGATAPDNPNVGELFYFTTTGATGATGLHAYNGSDWTALVTGTDLATHAADQELHLTPAEDAFLGAVTVDAVDVNQLSGLAGYLSSTGSSDLVAELTALDGGKASLEGAHFTGDITSGGKIGVGTTAPTHPLSITSGGVDKITLVTPTAGSAQLGSDTTGSLILSADEANAQAASKISLRVDGAERMMVNTAGVGIGTTPTKRLAVLEEARVERNIAQAIELSSLSAANQVTSLSSPAEPKPLIINATTDNVNTPVTAGLPPSIQFRTMGVEHARIGPDGAIGIGRQPTGYKVAIAADNHAGLLVEGGATTGAQVTIQRQSAVGTNTGSPAKLSFIHAGDEMFSIASSGATTGLTTYDTKTALGSHVFHVNEVEVFRIADGKVGVLTASPAVSLHVGGTDALRIPVGLTSQRPSSAAIGDIRFNTDITKPEFYDGTGWTTFDAGISEFVESIGGSSIADVINGKVSSSGGTFSGNVAFTNGATITGLPMPVNGSDAVNKDYVDLFVNGLRWTSPVDLATTEEIVLTGEQLIDGVMAVAGMRVLVKNQTNKSENGIYTPAQGAWIRDTDYDEEREVHNTVVYVKEGDTNSRSSFLQVNQDFLAPGAGGNEDDLEFIPFSGPVVNSAGNGIALTPSGNIATKEGAGVTYDGSGNITLDLYTNGGLVLTTDGSIPSTDPTAKLSLTKVGTPGTFSLVTTDEFGRVITGTNPTTLSGFGITDAVSKTGDAISGHLSVQSLSINGSLPSNSKLFLSGNVSQNVSAISAAVIDWSAGNYFTKTVSTATNFVFTNLPASGFSMITLKITNGGSAAVTWPPAVKWPGGTAPALTAAGIDIINLFTDDGGTTVFGIIAGKAMA